MSFIEFVYCIRNDSFHRKISLRLYLLSNLISCFNIKLLTLRNIFRNWYLLSNNFLFCFLIRLKCKTVSLKSSFLFWNCLTRIVNRSSVLRILFQFIMCQIEYFISMSNIASCSYKSRKSITSMESRMMIRSVHNIAWRY